MIYKFKLSGESLDLSKFEVETLFKTKCTRKGNIGMCNLSISSAKVKAIAEKSAMIKKIYSKDNKIWEVTSGRFNLRVPTARPAFHPTGMKPKMARMLVNITGAKKEILDPFCGIGATLIEAGVLGLKVSGSDYDPRMLDRTKTNLKYYKIKPKKIFKADATKLSEHLRKNSVEAITCDPPYGQSSTTSDKNLRNLFRSFMNEAHKVLKKKGRLVIIIPSKLKIPGLIPKEFKRLGKFDWYVHGGLTRQIVVLEK